MSRLYEDRMRMRRWAKYAKWGYPTFSGGMTDFQQFMHYLKKIPIYHSVRTGQTQTRPNRTNVPQYLPDVARIPVDVFEQIYDYGI